MTKFEFFSNQKRSFIQQTNNDNYITNTLPLSNSTLPHLSPNNSKSNYYPLNTTSANNDIESPVKVYSKSNYPFTPPSF